MQCFVSGRCTGKTTQLIVLSHDTGIPILARNANMAASIERQAFRMGIGIPKVVVSRVSGGCITPKRASPERVLVDEAGGVLEDALGVKVAAVSINGDALRIANPAIPDLGEMSLINLFKVWSKARKRKSGNMLGSQVRADGEGE